MDTAYVQRLNMRAQRADCDHLATIAGRIEGPSAATPRTIAVARHPTTTPETTLQTPETLPNGIDGQPRVTPEYLRSDRVRSRARPAPRPELVQHRAEWSVTSKTAAWRQLPAEKRFHRSYAVVPGSVAESECWCWIGVRSSEGYGHFMAKAWKPRPGQAGHYALEVIAGRGPVGRRRVYRQCDDTACVNPDHLSFDDTPLTWDDPITAPHLDGRTTPRPAATRFWDKVDRERGACWWWTGTVGPQGYGQFTLADGWATGAHRFAHASKHGSVPLGLHVCHGPQCEDHTGAGAAVREPGAPHSCHSGGEPG